VYEALFPEEVEQVSGATVGATAAVSAVAADSL